MTSWRKKQEEIYYYILFLLAFTLPLPKYIFSNVLIIALGLNWLAKIFLERNLAIEKKDRVIVFGSTLFFVLYLVGVMYSSNKHEAWSSVERKLPLFFLPLIVASFPPLSEGKIRNILITFLVSCTCVSLLCVGYTFWLNKELGIEFAYYNNYQFSEENLVREFGFHHVYFCMYLCFCQVIVIFLLRGVTSVYQKLFLVALAIFLLLFMMALSSRMGAIITVALITLAVALLLRRSVFFKTSLLVGILILFISIGYQFPFIREKFTGLFNIDVNEYSKMYQAGNRMVSIVSTWEIFKMNWFFGVGTGDVNDLLIKDYERINFQEGLIHTYNPHNQYLDTAGSVGILGLTALLGILFYPLYKCFKMRDFIGISFSVIVLFSLLTESMLSRQKGVVFFAFFLGILQIHQQARKPIMEF